MHGQPKIAIINPNTLAVLGLKNILQSIMPVISIDTFGSFEGLPCNSSDIYYHYFVTADILLDHRAFFLENRRKTIVLVSSPEPQAQISGFHCLCTGLPEHEFIKSLLALEQKAHANGHNLPPVPKEAGANVLSAREIEVMSLIVQGYINKEIADKLSIGLATVVTHRRNIMEKLSLRSVSALTIYAVMHGYVDISRI